MSLPLLLDDALTSTASGFVLRVSLPWIRSLPLSSVADIALAIDGQPAVARPRVAHDADWWFIQDRLELEGERMLAPGRHDVSLSFTLVIPYLQAGPSGPLTLPFRALQSLELDAPARRRSTTVAAISERRAHGGDENQRAIGASAFNWTPEVIRAERPAVEIAAGIVAGGVASIIELEPGQLWRSFPDLAEADVDPLRRELDALGGSVSIVGASLDDWWSRDRRRTEDERLAFLLPQLRAAHRVGAHGVRLPIGQAGEPLLRRLVPILGELDLVLYEEIQGQQTPESSAAAPAIDTLAQLDDPRVRLLVDISMLMPALPPSYLDRLREAGVPVDLVSRLESEWRDPATAAAVIEHLRSGAVPPAIHTMYMNLMIRFGRSDASDLRGILALVGAFHLKFWDLDDTDGRVSNPIRDLGAELARSGFAGTLTSEWGGHEWLDDDPAAMTRAHIALATDALATVARV